MQCVYDMIHSTCLRCEDRGWVCGEKLWGSETQSKLLKGHSRDHVVGQISFVTNSRPVPPPDDFSLMEHDGLYMQYFLEQRLRSCAATLLRYRDHVIGYEIIPQERYALLWSSIPMRWAALAFASFRKGNDRLDRTTLIYLGKSYMHVREALVSPKIDLLYTCYTLFML